MKECFGKIFPDIREFEYNKDYEGEVFSARINFMPIAVQLKEIKSDVEAWHHCFDCEHYQSCYDYSMAKLQFTVAIKTAV